jgi:8-oxo-dGTP diphosphatase
MGSAESVKRIDVAVAVLQRDNGSGSGDVLWCSRPEGKPYAGYWEFPGGKVEPTESVWQALVREIDEELGVTVQAGGPWMLVEHDYPHAKVRLHLMRVWRWQGEPVAREQQRFQWAPLLPSATDIQPILPATEPLLRKLAMPRVMLLTQVEFYGLDAFIQRLHATLSNAKAANRAMPLVQFREKNLSSQAQITAVAAVWDALQQYGAPMVVNSACRAACEWAAGQALALSEHQAFASASQNLLDKQYLQRPGVHWTEHDLTTIAQQGIDVQRINTASVHSADSLNTAYELGIDAAVLGTVLPSVSHPGGPTLAWSGFLSLASQARLPVYGIGGLSLDQLQTAAEHGAHGVAIMRAAWDTPTYYTT